MICHLGEIKIPAEHCQKDMDLSSDFKVLLPQRQGPGLCSTALVSYLIALHNDLVYCMDKHTGEETRWGRSCHIFWLYADSASTFSPVAFYYTFEHLFK